MLSEQDIELAHPDAFDFVLRHPGRGQIASGSAVISTGCRPCQEVVAEYSDIGQIIQNLPPHVEPPADLEDRAVAAMAAAQAGRAKPDRRSRHDAGVFPALPGTDRRSGDQDQAVTRVYPVSQPQPPAEAKPDRPSGERGPGRHPGLPGLPAPASG